jgi:hypothetical protein
MSPEPIIEAIIEKGRVGWWIHFVKKSSPQDIPTQSDGHWHPTKRGIDRCVSRERRRRCRQFNRQRYTETRWVAGGGVRD